MPPTATTTPVTPTALSPASLAPTAVASAPARNLSAKAKALLAIGSSQGGAGYTWFVAATSLWNKKLGSQMVVQTGGSSENAILLATGKADLAVTSLYDVSTVDVDGSKGYRGKIETLWPMFETPVHIIAAADTNIRSFADLKGHTVATGQTGASAYKIFNAVLPMVGMSAADLKQVALSKDAASEAMRNGTVDAWVNLGPVPTGDFVQVMESRRGGRLVPLPTQAIDGLVKQGLFAANEIPANSYKGQTAAVATVTTWFYAAVPAGFNADDAYLLAETLDKSYSELVAANPGAATATATNAARFVGFKLNPGVERYLKETGKLK